MLHVDYSGAISLRAMGEFDRHLLPLRAGVHLVIENFERAITLFTHRVALDRRNWPDWAPPSAAIVRLDQQSASVIFCAQLREIDVLRQTFLQNQAALATVWARSVVLLAPAR